MRPYTREDVLRWAGEPTFSRGLAYVPRMRVRGVQAGAGSFQAAGHVKGSQAEPYNVDVAWTGDYIQAICDCPMTVECKHAVALLLAVIDRQVVAPAAPDWRAMVAAHRAAPAAGAAAEADPLRFRLATRPSRGSRQGREVLLIGVGLALQPGFKAVNWMGLGGRRGIAPGARVMALAIARFLGYTTSDDLPEWLDVRDGAVPEVLGMLAQAPHVEDEAGNPLPIWLQRPVGVTLHYERDGDAGVLRPVVTTPEGTMAADAGARVVGDPAAWVWLPDGLHPLQGPAEALRDAGAPARIPPEERDEFERRHLPDMVVAGRLRGPGVPAAPEVRKIRPTPQLVLEEAGGKVRARLGFLYGGVRVEPGDPAQHVGPPEGPWYARRPGIEAKALARLPAVKPARSWMRPEPRPVFELAGADAVDFLFEDVERLLAEGFEVLGEDRLAYRPTRSTPTTHVSVSSGIDWLDVQAEVRVDDEVLPWPEVWAAIAEKRHYVRLGSGRLAKLPADWLKGLAPALEALGLGDRKAATPGRGRVPRHQAGLVSQLLQSSATANVDEGWRDLAEKLKSFGGVRDVPVPAGFTGELRPYQRKGLGWLAFLRDYGLHGILADDMGLGKTIQAAALLAANREAEPDGGPSLVVAPTSVIHNWRAELARFAPGLRVLVLHGPQREVERIPDHDVVITTYATLRLDLEAHQARPYHTLILDEAQAIKNARSQTAAAVRSLVARHRLCLTGTPIENNLLELWSQFAFLMPGLLGSEAEFRTRYAGPIAMGDRRAAAELKARVGPFILRRLKSDVAKDLPPRTDAVLWCELPPAQRRLYDTVFAASRARVLATVEEKGVERSHITILDALLKLRQVCCHPALLGTPETLRLPSAKLDAFLALVEELVAGGHRALVFSQFTSMLALLQERLDAAGLAYEYLDGATQSRQAKVDRFNKGATPLFLISLKAGGTGLNLTGADYVIHFDPWWNPAVEDQATDRAHRIGQTRHVFSYKLVAKDTIEEKLLDLQARKRALVRDVLDADELGKALTRADLEVLFGAGGAVGVSAAKAPKPAAAKESRPVPALARRARLAALMRERGELHNADYRACFGVEPEGARVALSRLVEAGVLVKEGERRGTRYLPGPGWAAWLAAEASARPSERSRVHPS